jgi:hypothetical protein
MQFAEFRKKLNDPIGTLASVKMRHWRLMASLVGLICLGPAAVGLIAWRDHANSLKLKACTERVQKGMTPAEVYAIFGRLPDQQDRPDTGMMGEFWRAQGMEDPNPQVVSSWHGADGASAGVVFRRGRVAGAHWHAPPPENTRDKWRRWFPFLNWK